MAFFYSDAQNSYLCIVERQKESSLRLGLEHRFRLSIVRASSTLRSAHAIFDLLIQIWIEIIIAIKRMFSVLSFF